VEGRREGGSRRRWFRGLSHGAIFLFCAALGLALPNESVAQTSPPTSGLVLQLEASTGITLDGSGGVSSWSDQSGNGHNATQGTAGNRPTVAANVLNGYPVVHFAGSTAQYLSLPNLLSGDTQAEALVVVRATTASGNNSGLWYFGTTGGNWYPLASGILYDSFGSNAQQTEGAPTPNITQFHVYDVSSQTGLWQSWIDGVPLYQDATNTVAFTSAPLLGQNGSGYGFYGDIAEILVYNHALSASDRQSASTYLAQKYAFISAPAAPTLLTAAMTSSDEAVVSWSNSTLTNTATTYVVQRQDNNSGTYNTVATILNGTSIIDTGLSPSVPSSYRVYAQNWAGTSGYSNVVNLSNPSVGASDFPTSGLRLWLTADATSQSPLDFWQDSSGNGNNAWQSTYGTRPTVTLNTLNGKPVVHFNGATPQYLSFGNFLSGATAGEAIVVLRASAASGNNSGLWYFGSDQWDWYPLANGTLDGTFGSTAEQSEGVPLLSLTQFHVYDTSAQAGLWQTWLDGVLQAHITSNTVGFSTAPLLGRNGGGYGFYGDIAEVIVYGRTLSATERYAVSAYLNQKYGIMAAPAAPTDLAVESISSSENILTWTASSASSLVQYLILRATSSGGPFTQIGSVAGTPTYLDATAVAGQQYYYEVVTQGTGGESSPSAAVAVTTLPSGTGIPLNGLNLWLIGDGAWESPLGYWQDYSGNNNNAFQNTTADQPTVVANALHGHSVVRFSGSSQFLTLPNVLNGATAGEMFVVTRTQSPVPTSGIALLQFGANSRTYGAIYPWTDGKIYDDFGSSAQQVVGNVAQPLNQAHIYNVTAQAGSWIARINGLEQYSNATNTVSFSSAPVLGTRLLEDIFYKGDIAEVMVYNRALSVEERIAVEYYLGGKYGVVSTPPAAPANFVAVPLSPNQVSLMWNEAPGNASIQYAIERQTGSGGYSLLGVVDNSASFIDTTAQPGTTYSYYVYAVNYAGASANSSTSTVTTPTAGLSMPFNGMVLWLKADAGVNTPVNSWQDQSGLDNSARQPVTANQPTLLNNSINGRPVVHFSGSSEYLNLPNVMSGASSGEIFVVTQVPTAMPTTGSVLLQFGANANTYGAVYPWTDGKLYDDFGSSAQQVLGTFPVITQPHIYNVSAQAGSWVARINGNQVYSNATNTVSFTTTPLLGTRLMKDYTYNGNVAEVIVYNRVLSAEERGLVLSYLDYKYLIPAMDADGDGLTNAQKLALGLNPYNPDQTGDGFWNGVAVSLGLNPATPITLYPNPNGPPSPTPPAPAPGTMVITLSEPAGAVLYPSP
jgi:hypothetical protein